MSKQQTFIEQYMNTSGSLDRLAIIIEWGYSQQKEPGVNMKKIDGCQAIVYYTLSAEDGIVHFDGWSNSSLMAGIIQLCIYFYNGVNIANLTEEDFSWIEDIDLISSISHQRGVAIMEIINGLKGLVLI